MQVAYLTWRKRRTNITYHQPVGLPVCICGVAGGRTKRARQCWFGRKRGREERRGFYDNEEGAREGELLLVIISSLRTLSPSSSRFTCHDMEEFIDV